METSLPPKSLPQPVGLMGLRCRLTRHLNMSWKSIVSLRASYMLNTAIAQFSGKVRPCSLFARCNDKIMIYKSSAISRINASSPARASKKKPCRTVLCNFLGSLALQCNMWIHHKTKGGKLLLPLLQPLAAWPKVRDCGSPKSQRAWQIQPCPTLLVTQKRVQEWRCSVAIRCYAKPIACT